MEKNKKHETKRVSKSKRFLAVLLSILTFMSCFSVIPVSALSWNGSSFTNASGSSYAPSDAKYSVPANDSDQVRGYRFAVIDKGNEIKGTVVDLYKNDNARKFSSGSSSSYRYTFGSSNRKPKSYWVEKYKTGIENVKFDLKRNMTGTFYAATSGKSSGSKLVVKYAVPSNPAAMKDWQETDENLNPVIEKMLGSGKSKTDLELGDRITVEPIYGVEIDGLYCALTETEIALYGAARFGGKSTGNEGNASAGYWRYIKDYVNRDYANRLYTDNEDEINGMWGVVTDVNTKKFDTYSFNTIIKKGYGVGIAYTPHPKIQIRYNANDGTPKQSGYYVKDNLIYTDSKKTKYKVTELTYGGGKKVLTPPDDDGFDLERSNFNVNGSSYNISINKNGTKTKAVSVDTEHSYNYYYNIAIDQGKTDSGTIILYAIARWSEIPTNYTVCVDPGEGTLSYKSTSITELTTLGKGLKATSTSKDVFNVSLTDLTTPPEGHSLIKWIAKREANGYTRYYGQTSTDSTDAWRKSSAITSANNYANYYGYKFTMKSISDAWTLNLKGTGHYANAKFTFIAKYKENAYSVKFHGNGYTGGSSSPITQNFTYTESKKLEANKFRRNFVVNFNYNGGTGINDDGNTVTTDSNTVNSSFEGWATSKTGNVVYSDKQKVSKLTKKDNGVINLYAVWDDGQMLLPEPNNNKPGYTFAGWYTAASGGTKIGNANAKFIPADKFSNPTDADTKLTPNSIDLYAQWTPVPVETQYVLNAPANEITLGNGYTTTSSSYSYLKSGEVETTNDIFVSINKSTIIDKTEVDSEKYNVKTASDLGLSRAGYTFTGWKQMIVGYTKSGSKLTPVIFRYFRTNEKDGTNHVWETASNISDNGYSYNIITNGTRRITSATITDINATNIDKVNLFRTIYIAQWTPVPVETQYVLNAPENEITLGNGYTTASDSYSYLKSGEAETANDIFVFANKSTIIDKTEVDSEKYNVKTASDLGLSRAGYTFTGWKQMIVGYTKSGSKLTPVTVRYFRTNETDETNHVWETATNISDNGYSYNIIKSGTRRITSATIADINATNIAKVNLFRTIYIAQWEPNTVTVNVKKDGTAWNDSGMSIKLKNKTAEYTLTNKAGTNSYVAPSGIAILNGTYNIYATDKKVSGKIIDAGVTVTVTGSGNATVNYYTLTLNAGTGIEKVNGNAGTYLKNTVATINAPTLLPGYSFYRWQNTKNTYSTPSFTLPITGKTDLTAEATLNEYSVEYRIDNKQISIEKHTINDKFSIKDLPEDKLAEGYKFTSDNWVIKEADKSNNWSEDDVICGNTVSGKYGNIVLNINTKQKNARTITYKWSTGKVIDTSSYIPGIGLETLLSQGASAGYEITPEEERTWSMDKAQRRKHCDLRQNRSFLRFNLIC